MVDQPLATWKAFDGWLPPRSRVDWTASDAWKRSFDRVCDDASAQLEKLLKPWDIALEDVGGDPAREDWTRFRPLRLSREEDWSDWLAHLLATSHSGGFAELLLKPTMFLASYKAKRVDRESSADGYRADVVVWFETDLWLQLEVKVGDLALEKTVPTGDALRRKYGASNCLGDVLLLPKDDVEQLSAVRSRLAAEWAAVTVLTWQDVARALRRSLAEHTESISWRVWARTFLGAIEQVLLFLPPVQRMRTRMAQANVLRRQQWMNDLRDES